MLAIFKKTIPLKKYFFILLLFSVKIFASAPDTIIQVTWRQISGPVQCSIDSIHRPHANVTGFVQPGLYKFEFTVVSSYLDSAGNHLSASDTMQITVLPATVLAVIRTDIAFRFFDNTAIVTWSVTGNDIDTVILQKSLNGYFFFDLQKVFAVGSKDFPRENRESFYRLRIVSGRNSVLSKIIYLPGTNENLTVHQDGNATIVWSDLPGSFILYDATGRILKTGTVVNGMTKIVLRNMAVQVFLLKIQTGEGVSVFKMPVH